MLGKAGEYVRSAGECLVRLVDSLANGKVDISSWWDASFGNRAFGGIQGGDLVSAVKLMGKCKTARGVSTV